MGTEAEVEDKKVECCPICRREEYESRAIGVECFYSVKEIVPQAKEVHIYGRLKGPGTYVGGTTYRYSGGLVEGFELENTTISESGTPTHKYKATLNPAPEDEREVRLLRKSIYYVEACKSCRADFLDLFRRFALGEFVSSSGEGNIPIRVAGALKHITREQWDEMNPGREPFTVKDSTEESTNDVSEPDGRTNLGAEQPSHQLQDAGTTDGGIGGGESSP